MSSKQLLKKSIYSYINEKGSQKLHSMKSRRLNENIRELKKTNYYSLYISLLN